MASDIAVNSSDWVPAHSRGWLSGNTLDNPTGPAIEYSTSATPTVATGVLNSGSSLSSLGPYLWLRGAGAVSNYTPAEWEIKNTKTAPLYVTTTSAQGVKYPSGHVLADAIGPDHATSLNAICASAGPGATIELVAGQTYTLSRTFRPGPGQRLVGNGATLKRAAQPSWTTSTAITSGSTSVIVLDTPAAEADLQVGDRIAAHQGLRYTSWSTVQSISADRKTVTLTGALGVGSSSVAVGGKVIDGPFDTSIAFTGSTTIVRVWWLLDLADAAFADDIVIDGNRSQVVAAKWDTQVEIRTKRIETLGKIEIKEAASEGILGTGDDSDYTYDFSPSHTPWKENGLIGPFYIHDCGGNGLHFSGTRDITIHPGSRFLRLNQDPSVGHVGGGLCYSWGGRSLTVSGCLFVDCYAAIGFSGIPNSSRLIFTANYAYDLHRYFVQASGGSAWYQSDNFIVADNIGQNSGDLLISSGGGKRFTGLNVHHNNLIGTTMRFEAVDGGSVDHNTVDCRYFIPTTTTAVIQKGVTMSVPVASLTGYAVGDRVRFVKNGVVSQSVCLTSVTGTLQWDRPIAQDIASGADVVKADLRDIAVAASATLTTGDTQITLRNAGLIKVNQWLSVFNTSSNVGTTRMRVKAVDYTTGVVQIDGTFDKTYSSGTTVVSYGSLIDDTGCIRSESSEITIGDNTLRGQSAGVWMNGAHTAKTRIDGNTISDYRSYGILGSGTANSYEKITDNSVITPTTAATWGNAIYLQSKQTAVQNNCVVPASTHDNAIKVMGSGCVLDGNEIRVGGGSAATGSAIRLQNSGSVCLNTKTNGTVVDGGTNTVSGTTAITA